MFARTSSTPSDRTGHSTDIPPPSTLPDTRPKNLLRLICPEPGHVLDKVRKIDQDAVRQDLHAAADNRTKARSAANRFATRWEDAYPKAVACLRDDLDDLLTCFRYKDPDQRRQVRTTNAIERRFREVRRRTPPMGAFQDRTSMDRILFAIFLHENKQQGIVPSDT